MSEQTTTPFSEQARMLGDLWIQYRDDEAFEQLFDYGDLGFPLAYGYAEGLIGNDLSETGKTLISELWAMLLESLGIEDTYQFTEIDDLLDSVEGSIQE